jgi:hypothetical protein
VYEYETNHSNQQTGGAMQNGNLPSISVGDTVKVGVLIQEGEKTRVQPYQGWSSHSIELASIRPLPSVEFFKELELNGFYDSFSCLERDPNSSTSQGSKSEIILFTRSSWKSDPTETTTKRPKKPRWSKKRKGVFSVSEEWYQVKVDVLCANKNPSVLSNLLRRGLEIGQYRLFLSPLAKIPFERHERYLCYALTFITFNKGISIAI